MSNRKNVRSSAGLLSGARVRGIWEPPVRKGGLGLYLWLVGRRRGFFLWADEFLLMRIAIGVGAPVDVAEMGVALVCQGLSRPDEAVDFSGKELFLKIEQAVHEAIYPVEMSSRLEKQIIALNKRRVFDADPTSKRIDEALEVDAQVRNLSFPPPKVEFEGIDVAEITRRGPRWLHCGPDAAGMDRGLLICPHDEMPLFVDFTVCAAADHPDRRSDHVYRTIEYSAGLEDRDSLIRGLPAKAVRSPAISATLRKKIFALNQKGVFRNDPYFFGGRFGEAPRDIDRAIEEILRS